MPVNFSVATVTWRQSVASVVALMLALTGLIVVVRSDGLPAIDAAASRATRWLVHGPTASVVLVDGFGGRALASLEGLTGYYWFSYSLPGGAAVPQGRIGAGG